MEMLGLDAYLDAARALAVTHIGLAGEAITVRLLHAPRTQHARAQGHIEGCWTPGIRVSLRHTSHARAALNGVGAEQGPGARAVSPMRTRAVSERKVPRPLETMRACMHA